MEEPNKKPLKKKFKFRLDFSLKNIILWVLVLLILTSFVNSFFTKTDQPEEIALSTALSDIKEDKVESVDVEDNLVTLQYKDNNGQKISRKEPNVSFTEILQQEDIPADAVKLNIKDTSKSKIISDILFTVLPLIATIAFFFFIFRQARGAQDSIFSFGKSKAKLFSKGKQDITFADVAGVKEAKDELVEVVDFLKNPGKYRRVGARTPKGVLLVGPSGVGKTLLAKAVAGEAGVPFFSMAGSEFMEMLVGVGASVTGDTPILIRQNGITKLLPISEFIDHYYEKDKEGYVIKVNNIETLGFKKKTTGFWGSRGNKRMVLENSAWQPVSSVYRHLVKEIYEIHYLDGVIRATGDHSVFIREHGGITAKKVTELKKNDVLVNLPMNVRHWDSQTKKTIHSIKKHLFDANPIELSLDVWNEDHNQKDNWQYALVNKDNLYQYQIAQNIGVSQMTVSNWQRNIHVPRILSRKLVKLNLPERVKVTPALMKLFGYYTAEGRGTNNLELTFGLDEKELVADFAQLMEKVFGLKNPVLEKTDTNTIRIKYYSAHLGRFFTRFCGNGCHQKHVPEFIWDLPTDYFLAYLEGYTLGDGYITKSGKLCATSVSQQLIREIAWLCSMHGIKVGIKHEITKAGRVIRNKLLPECESWQLIIGKTSNPFLDEKISYPYQIKRCVIKKIIKKPYHGFVYDLCGVENEAFFGGEKPVLLHNSRVRDLFLNAKKAAPAIIFIDEIDAIGRQRGSGFAGGHDEREQTLNQILVEMDGFTPNDNVCVLAATNRGDLLDPALLRPGRFDRRVTLDFPDIEDRIEILAIHARGKPFVKGVDWNKVAKATVGFSGADLENMLNEAAIMAARNNRRIIDPKDIDEASLRVKMGPEKKRLQSDEDKKVTAYHEAGHAVISYLLPLIDPVHRVSIVSRGLALGFTLIPPRRDRYNETKSHLLETIVTLLAGRAAEELVFNEFTSGAASDIDKATQIARQMVINFGMSELGPIYLGPQYEQGEYGRSWMAPAEISSDMKSKIDQEIKKIIDTAFIKAQKLVKDNRKKLDLITDKLLFQETIEGEEFDSLMGSKAAKAVAGV